MRRQLGWLGLMGGAVLGVAGCGTSTVPIDNVGDEFVGALCEEVRRCPEAWGDELGLVVNLFEQGADDASCEDLLASIPQFARTPAEAEGVENGTIEYDGAQARRCVRALVDDCIPLDLIELVEECEGVFTGTRENGQSCEATSECAPSSYCELSSACNGTCTAQVAAGAPCTTDDECRSGSCEFDGLGSTCVEYTLVRGAGLGEACGPVDDEGSTRTNTVCTAGLYCRDTPAGGVCAEPIAAGASCQGNEVCAAGYFCEEGSCRTATFASTVGASCGGATYILCDATLGLACNADTDRCVSVGDGSVGSPCSYADDEFLAFFACDDGLYCDTDADVPVCRARLEVGAACDSDRQCETGYCVSDLCSTAVLCEPGLIFMPL